VLEKSGEVEYSCIDRNQTAMALLLKGGRTMKKWIILTCSLVALPAAALAAGGNLPVEIQTSQGIQFYNGGAGLDERSEMSQIYPLKVVLATDGGLYLNDAEIVISTTDGKEVFRAQADNGPWLVADVPPGSYSLEASLEGRTTAASVEVSAGQKKVVVLSWKTSEVDMGL
jgi:hypothetical protein